MSGRSAGAGAVGSELPGVLCAEAREQLGIPLAGLAMVGLPIDDPHLAGSRVMEHEVDDAVDPMARIERRKDAHLGQGCPPGAAHQLPGPASEKPFPSAEPLSRKPLSWARSSAPSP